MLVINVYSSNEESSVDSIFKENSDYAHVPQSKHADAQTST